MSKIALIILDGFGITSETRGNAILQAKTPYLDFLFNNYPKTLLRASSQEVGLPWGEVGNSEVGHTNIGLGRVVLQDLPQIDKIIAEDKLFENKTLVDSISQSKNAGGNVHIIGLLSDGAVHCHINHIIALVQALQKNNFQNKIIIHIIADGRDVQEKSIERYIEKIKPILSEQIAVGSISGRYFAMDRDKNWDRIQAAFDAISGTSNVKYTDVSEAIKTAYAKNETDEFITPGTIGDTKIDFGKDLIIFANYRADRAIQLSRAFIDKNLSEINKTASANNFVSMTTYEDNLGLKVLFSNLDLNNKVTNPLSNPLSKIISDSGKTQFHVGETEKFAHVTYFFAGGVKEEFPGQENKLIPSEKVKSYDLFPQMKAKEITEEIMRAVNRQPFDLIVANYANGDMVGHSGKIEAAIKTIEILDFYLKYLLEYLQKNSYTIIITADHGNCDEMIDLKSGKVNKEHTGNPVPFIYVNNNKGEYLDKQSFFSLQPTGLISDIATSILTEFEISIPQEMQGGDLRQALT